MAPQYPQDKVYFCPISHKVLPPGPVLSFPASPPALLWLPIFQPAPPLCLLNSTAPWPSGEKSRSNNQGGISTNWEGLNSGNEAKCRSFPLYLNCFISAFWGSEGREEGRLAGSSHWQLTHPCGGDHMCHLAGPRESGHCLKFRSALPSLDDTFFLLLQISTQGSSLPGSLPDPSPLLLSPSISLQ